MPTVLTKPPKVNPASRAKKNDFKVSFTGSTIQTLNIAISGLVPFPVKILTPYNQPVSRGARLGCPGCYEFISMPRQCTNDECEYHGVLPEHAKPLKIVTEGDMRIVLKDEDMDFLDLPTKDNFMIEGVVPFKDVEELLVYADGSYYTAPATSNSAKLYTLTVQMLKKQKRCIVGKYTLRTGSEKLAIIRPFGGCLVIQNVPFPALRRSLPEWTAPEVTANDMATVERVFAELPQEYIWANSHDEYGAAITKLISDTIEEQTSAGKKKRTKKKFVPENPAEDRDAVEDLFSSLEAQSGGKIRFERGG